MNQLMNLAKIGSIVPTFVCVLAIVGTIAGFVYQCENH